MSICKNSAKYHLLCFHKSESPIRNSSTAEQGYLLRNKETTCSQKQDPKFWSATVEWNSPRTTFVNWIDKLNFMLWKIGILLLGMNNVQTRTKPTWRRIGRITKSTSRNSSQKYSWNVRVEESSRISSRWVFEKKIDRKSRYVQGTQSAERRNKTCSTEKIEVTKATHKLGCNTRQPRRWKLEQRWVKRFVWFLDRFHSVCSFGGKNLQTDMCGPVRDWQKRQVTSRPNHLWPEIWQSMSRNSKMKD